MKKSTSAQNRLFGCLVAGLLLMLMSGDAYGQQNNAPPFPRATLTVQRAHRKPVIFNVEVATTPEQHNYGLMFRRALPKRSGMLFLWDEDQPISMWMKNTYIPLDFLFVRGDGAIVKIVHHAPPLDLTPIPSEQPVRAVVEINADEANDLGLKTGDKVLFPAVSGGNAGK